MKLLTLLILLISSTALAVPSKLILTNQFGEKSVNTLTGPSLPLAGAANVILLTGATAPINGTTGDNIAAKGSLYIAQDTGQAYTNTGVITNPTWTASSGTGITAVLTGFLAGAGTVASSDTILEAIDKLAGNTQNLTVLANVLTGFVAASGTTTSSDTVLSGLQKAQGNDAALKNGTFTPTVQPLSGAGAVNTTSMETTVTNAGLTYAVTLAAPSSQDGQMKIIKAITAMTGTVTLAMTNIAMSGSYVPTGVTTLTFTSVGDSAVFIAVGAKWVYLGGSAIAS